MVLPDGRRRGGAVGRLECNAGVLNLQGCTTVLLRLRRLRTGESRVAPPRNVCRPRWRSVNLASLEGDRHGSKSDCLHSLKVSAVEERQETQNRCWGRTIGRVSPCSPPAKSAFFLLADHAGRAIPAA